MKINNLTRLETLYHPSADERDELHFIPQTFLMRIADMVLLGGDYSRIERILR